MAVYVRRNIHVTVTDYLGVYRCLPHATMGVAPAVLLHGRLPRTWLSIVGLSDSSFHENPAQAMKLLRQRVRQKQASSKLYTDGRHGARTRHFAVGDYVHVKKSSDHRKLSSHFSELKKITEQWGGHPHLFWKMVGCGMPPNFKRYSQKRWRCLQAMDLVFLIGPYLTSLFKAVHFLRANSMLTVHLRHSKK